MSEEKDNSHRKIPSMKEQWILRLILGFLFAVVSFIVGGGIYFKPQICATETYAVVLVVFPSYGAIIGTVGTCIFYNLYLKRAFWKILVAVVVMSLLGVMVILLKLFYIYFEFISGWAGLFIWILSLIIASGLVHDIVISLPEAFKKSKKAR